MEGNTTRRPAVAMTKRAIWPCVPWGVRTLRYSNLDILKDAEGVAEAAPSPSLSPNGLGERGIPSQPSRHPTRSLPALEERE
jgi:hypothetical protein